MRRELKGGLERTNRTPGGRRQNLPSGATKRGMPWGGMPRLLAAFGYLPNTRGGSGCGLSMTHPPGRETKELRATLPPGGGSDYIPR